MFLQNTILPPNELKYYTSLTKMSINKKHRFLDAGSRRVLKINEPYIFKSYRKLTLDSIVFIYKSGIFRFYKERNCLIKDICIL